MTTVWEKQAIDQAQAEEAKRHNQMVHERYLRLQNAEEMQLSETFERAEQAKNAAATIVSPVVEQKPAEKTVAPVYIERNRGGDTPVQRELFTAETLRRVIADGATIDQHAAKSAVAEEKKNAYAPLEVQAVRQNVAETQVAAETYSLTSAAKAVIAAFATLVVLMLTIIGINTRILNARGAEVVALEEKRAELVAESRELAGRIAEATDEETIAEWAEQNGWTR